jgi:DNA-binding transcriptional LysR family regulator
MKANKLDLYYRTFPVEFAKPEFTEVIAQYDSAFYAAPELVESWNPVSDQDPLSILVPPHGFGFREAIEKTLKETGVTNYKLVSDIPAEAYIEVVQNGKAAAIFSRDRIRHLLKKGVVKEMTKDIPPISMGRYLFKRQVTSVAVAKVEEALSSIIVEASKVRL